MKEITKMIIIVVAGLLGAAVPLYAFYSLWDWCMSQVPVAEWAGLAKIALTMFMILVGGGFTVGCAFLAGSCGVAAALAILDP